MIPPLTRREFLWQTGAALAAGQVSPVLDPNSLTKFVDALPVPQVARPGGAEKATTYRIPLQQAERKLHRDLPATRLWTYGGSLPGPTVEVRSGRAVRIEWANELPARHFLPIDHHLHGAEADKPEVRAVTHVHGAKVPPESDGYPEDWYVPGKSRTYDYPNHQDAATLWYHDHAMGINRLNIYAGLFGFFLVRDDVEDALNLPGGRYEIPLAICDRFLRRDGQLHYEVSGAEDAPWVPEMFGNAMLVNGKLFPYLEVEPRKYRFRLLNASNGRFYHLSLGNEQSFSVIGTDQGLLRAPVGAQSFVIAPGERLDVVIDFREHAGEQILLRSDSFELMQFRVGRRKVEDTSSLPRDLRPVPRLLEKDAAITRALTIDEYMNKAGETMLMLLNRSHWDMPVTERPVLNTTEIWSIVNPTDDSHPIHLHLVRFQILDRRRFDQLTYRMTGQVRYTGAAEPPEPSESGWKDTVRAHSSMVTRFIVRFEGYTGRYVWHCHVLEHEDNEMMRPFEVVAPARG